MSKPSARQSANRLLLRAGFVFRQPPQVKFHLPFVGRFEGTEFQVDGNQSAKLAVEEEQVDVKILAVDHDPLLPGEKREAGADFEDELFQFPKDRGLNIVLAVGVLESKEIEQVRVAEDEVGRELIGLPQRGEFLFGQLLWLTRQSSPLE